MHQSVDAKFNCRSLDLISPLITASTNKNTPLSPHDEKFITKMTKKCLMTKKPLIL